MVQKIWMRKNMPNVGKLGGLNTRVLFISAWSYFRLSLRALHFSLPLPAPRWFCQIVQPRGYTRTPTGALRYFFPCAIVICAAVECDRVGDEQADGQMTQVLSHELTGMRNLRLCYCSKIICSWNCRWCCPHLFDLFKSPLHWLYLVQSDHHQVMECVLMHGTCKWLKCMCICFNALQCVPFLFAFLMLT